MAAVYFNRYGYLDSAEANVETAVEASLVADYALVKSAQRRGAVWAEAVLGRLAAEARGEVTD